MLIGAFYPLLELFDRWDAPGLSNDTEFRVDASLFCNLHDRTELE